MTQWPWDVGDPAAPTRSVSVERALTLVPVFGAARLLADSIASLTPYLYTGGGDVPRRQPTPSLLRQPSVHGTLFDWLHRAVVSMALQGDAVGLITARDYYGFPTMVEWLNPESVEVIDSAPSGPGSYMQPIWRWFGQQVRAEDIVHVPWFCTPYRVRGLSPVGAFKLTANVGLGAAEYAAAWFANGGVPPGVFRNSEQLVPREEADMITARLTSRLRQRKPLVFGRDWAYEPIAIKPNEAQFIETSRLTATEIAVIYGIPPEKIGGSTGSSLTYSTLEQHSLDFLTFSLRPWLVRVEMALSGLFPRGQFVKFDTADLIRADAKTRAEIDQISLGAQPPPYRTVDEIRADHDLPPMPKPPPAPVPAPRPPAVQPGRNGSTPPPMPVMKGNNPNAQ